MTPGRRLVAELMHQASQVPSAPLARTCCVAALASARQQAIPTPSWTALFLRAYALVARDLAELRRAWVPFPWARLYEHPHSVAAVVIEREVDGEPMVLGAKVPHPENQSLEAIDAHLRYCRTAPPRNITAFRQLIRLARLPWPLGRFFLWKTLSTSGFTRASRLGTFVVSSLGHFGVEQMHPLTPLTSYFTFGPIQPDGAVTLKVIYDHRVMDGRCVARVLSDMEDALNGVLLEEVRRPADEPERPRVAMRGVRTPLKTERHGGRSLHASTCRERPPWRSVPAENALRLLLWGLPHHTVSAVACCPRGVESRMRPCCAAVPLFVLLFAGLAPAEDPPKPLKFDEVKEIAPGVFFRYSAISPDQPQHLRRQQQHLDRLRGLRCRHRRQLPQGSRRRPCGHPQDDEEADPLRPRHAPSRRPRLRQRVWVEAGATIVAQTHCARLLRLTGPDEFAAAGKGPTGRKDVAASTLKMPNADLRRQARPRRRQAARRVPATWATRTRCGDAVAYLPKHKILCTGDACVNGAFNFMGHSDSASWIRCLEKMQQLDVKTVLPGPRHAGRQGTAGEAETLLRRAAREVKKGIDAGKEIEDIVKAIDLPWYKEWTTVKPAEDNIKHVYNEMTGAGGAVGPGPGLRHLRGALADEGDAGLDEAEEDCRSLRADACAAGGTEAGGARGAVPAGAQSPGRG